MTATNRWVETGRVRKSDLLKVKATLTAKATSSTATAAKDDYYEFNCKTKNLPSFSESPTWTDKTDSASEPTGYAYAAKSDQIQPIEVVTRIPIPLVYGDLLAHKAAGDVFTVAMKYDDPLETSIYDVAVPNCTLIDVIPAVGDNADSQLTLRFLPEGGSSDNMPDVTTSSRSSG